MNRETISPRVVIALVVAVLAGIIAYWRMPAPLPELSRAEFMAEVRTGHVRRVEINDQEVILSVSTTRGPFRTAFDKARDAASPTRVRALGSRFGTRSRLPVFSRMFGRQSHGDRRLGRPGTALTPA